MKVTQKLLNHLEMIADEDKVETVMNVAAGIVVKEDENGNPMVLLIQRAADDHWPLHFEFPRGKCDKGPNEKPRPCAIREIKEETGLDVVIDEFIGKFEYLADAGKRKSICYNYTCKMKNPEQKIKLSHEHRTFKWITQMGEAEMMVHQDQKRFLEKILSVDNPIISTPENDFTKNNKLEEANMLTDEYLKQLQEANESFSGGGYTAMSTNAATVLAGLSAVAIAGIAFKAAEKIITDKKCKAYKVSSAQYKICHKKIKIEKLKKQIAIMTSKSSLCNKTKNPEKCKTQIKEKIQQIQFKIKKLQIELKQLEKTIKF